MSFKMRLDSVDHVELVLACDPAIEETNDSGALARYRRDGDSGELTIPEEAARFTVRPYTPKDLRAAARAAGRLPHRGRRVDERQGLDPEIKAARAALALAHAKRLGLAIRLEEAVKAEEETDTLREELAEMGPEVQAAQDALDDAMDAWSDSLSDDDDAALTAWRFYLEAKMLHLTAGCLIGHREGAAADPSPRLTKDEAIEVIESMGAKRPYVIAELHGWVYTVSELGSEGKARLERGFGSALLSDSEALTTGPATPAEPPSGPLSSEAPVAAPS